METTTARLLLTTCPDTASARRIARALVEQRLAACASYLPGMISTYRWQGAIQEDEEVQLLIKTQAHRVEAAIAHLQALHPYEVPEVLVLPISAGLPTYLNWIDEQTREDD